MAENSVNAVSSEATVANTEVQNTQVANNEVSKDVKTPEDTIVKIKGVYEYEGKIKLETDGSFVAINPETGEEVKTNKLSFSKINLINQLKDKVDHILLAATLGIGQEIPTSFFGLVLTNASIKVRREFFVKGEVLEEFALTAQNDGYKTTILECKTNINKSFENFINDTLCKLQMGAFKQPKPTMINPFA